MSIEAKNFNYVYQTKNLINNKTYIGVHGTNNLNDGYLGSGDKIRESIKKYGKNNFKLEVLEFFNSIEEAYKEEQYLVDELWVKSRDNYNMTLGGKIPPSFLGRTVSEETKKKISLKNTGKVRSVETRIKIGLAGLGRKVSEETRLKRSISLKGKNTYKRTQEQIDKIKATRLKNGGYGVSDETRRKLSVAGKGRVKSPETLLKMKTMRVGYTHSETTVNKLKKAHANQTKEQKIERYKDRSKAVEVFDVLTNKKIGEFYSISAGAYFVGMSPASALSIAKGKTKSPKKYVFKYL